MKKSKERLNPWKVTAAILVVGGLCWLALHMLGCVSMINTGKGDQDYGREDQKSIEQNGTNKVSDVDLRIPSP